MALISHLSVILPESPKEIDGLVSIGEKTKLPSTWLYTCSYRNKNYCFYYKDDIDIESKIYVKATVKEYRKETIPLGFDEYHYHLGNNTYGYLSLKKIEIRAHEHSSLALMFEKYLSGYSENSISYIKAFIFGEKLKDEYLQLGIVWIFGLSGIVIFAIEQILKKVFFYLDLPALIQEIVLLVFTIFLGFLTAFAFLVFRYLLSKLLKLGNKYLNLSYSKLDLFFLMLMLIFLIRPYYYYNLGVITSLIIVASLTLYSHMFSRHKRIQKSFMLALVILLATGPIILKFNNEYFLLNVAITPLFSMATQIISLPLVLLTLFIKPFDGVLNLYVATVEFFLEKIASLSFLFIRVPKPTHMQIYFYCALLLFVLLANTKKKLLFRIVTSMLLYTFCVFMLFIQTTNRIYFLDVGQGDSTVIRHEGKTMVIDTFTNTCSFLKNNNFIEIEALVITHSDNDHSKEVKEILKYCRVQRVFISAYDTNYSFFHKNTTLLKSGDIFQMGTLKFETLGPINKYSNNNNNSLVLKTQIGKQKFIFTGDIELDAERDLVLKYGNLLDCDILKVPHHGSSTSSHEDFIRHTSPKYAIISAGHENFYGFPHSSVLREYQKYKAIVYVTSKNGSIILENGDHFTFMNP